MGEYRKLFCHEVAIALVVAGLPVAPVGSQARRAIVRAVEETPRACHVRRF